MLALVSSILLKFASIQVELNELWP